MEKKRLTDRPLRLSALVHCTLETRAPAIRSSVRPVGVPTASSMVFSRKLHYLLLCEWNVSGGKGSHLGFYTRESQVLQVDKRTTRTS
jgi:hypothetical protein